MNAVATNDTYNTTTPNNSHNSRERILADLGLMTPEQVALALDVSTHTLMVWRGQNAGPDYVKKDRIILYRRKDVLDWIERQVTPTTRTAR